MKVSWPVVHFCMIIAGCAALIVLATKIYKAVNVVHAAFQF